MRAGAVGSALVQRLRVPVAGGRAGLVAGPCVAGDRSGQARQSQCEIPKTSGADCVDSGSANDFENRAEDFIVRDAVAVKPRTEPNPGQTGDDACW
jgi:hypothetical protein